MVEAQVPTHIGIARSPQFSEILAAQGSADIRREIEAYQKRGRASCEYVTGLMV